MAEIENKEREPSLASGIASSVIIGTIAVVGFTLLVRYVLLKEK